MIEQRPITNRDEWLAWRREDVTASVVPALFGLHPYITPLRVYAEKRGVEFANDENKVMRRGRWLEPAIGEAVRDLRPQWKITPARVYFRDPDLRLGATPDFFIEEDPRGLGVLQGKTVAPSVWKRDWDSGQRSPLWVMLQTSTEMMLSEAAFGAIAVMLVDAHNMDVEIIEIERHPAAFSRITARVQEFWINVADGNEPLPDFYKDAELIKHLTPHEIEGKAIDLTGNNEIPGLLARRELLRGDIADAERECTAVEAQLKYLMQDAETVSGIDGWHISYRTQHRKGYTVQPSSPRVLRIYDRRTETNAD